jgi:RluA family pseudouridine synthase
MLAAHGGKAPMSQSESRLKVPAARAGLRADEYLSVELPFLSRTRIKHKIMMGESLLNGRRYATSTRLKEDDEIVISWRRPPEDAPVSPLPILFEDGHIMAVDKPAGVPSHPSGIRQSGTVIQFARERHRARIEADLSGGGRDFYPCLVNRLDMRTSGVILIALHRETLAAMHAMIARGGIRKTYLAVVDGTLDVDRGMIELPLGRDEESAVGIKMAARPDGLPCVTEYEVIRRLPAHTVVHAFPRTGRQHQVRAHFAAIGHPVWGDLIYKDERLFLRYWDSAGSDSTLPPRHLLHAERVSFTHPVTGERVEIASEPPEDFKKIAESLG